MRHPAPSESAARQPLADAVQLTDAERQPCEVWTRVMGYHRPVASFNIGKQGEHAERRFFQAPGR
ncbi:Anaerobic ribonucleoside-triphosphate reductase [Oryzisolibacter propanilivorax]|uniref:Anaerobic ribonucleoside-triphosphate reductase n=1 Tax=Oryzisolibacter propanilivorax TaxID=1527607 RepID=A0A1G9QIQ1_9BURK|nr:anaerobic ribonucleoside-triphosphate reductase [Oryzisolibacter propanilivorax]SDM10671.1 Anaerobic ribonucleoside-triphosphate reductase [Oryzisolibacter propanilivorax]